MILDPKPPRFAEAHGTSWDELKRSFMGMSHLLTKKWQGGMVYRIMVYILLVDVSCFLMFPVVCALIIIRSDLFFPLNQQTSGSFQNDGSL